MSSYQPPNYMNNNQFVPTFNGLNFSEPNTTTNTITIGQLDNRYLKKISNDTTNFTIYADSLYAEDTITTNGNISAAGITNLNDANINNLKITDSLNASSVLTSSFNNISCSNISFSTDSYRVSRYGGANIFYNSNNAVYLQVSLTLEANTKWLISYIGTNIYLYQSSPTTVFLSTLNSSNTSVDIKNALVPFSQITMKGSGTTGVMTYFTPANQVYVSPSVNTTYYLYACSNASAPSPPTTTDVLYSAGMSGGFTDPDGYIVLSAIRIR